MPYYIGSLPCLSVLFTDAAGNPADPTAVSLIVISPDSISTTYTYPSPIVRDETGAYHYDLTITQVGTYSYEWIGTGAVSAVKPGTLKVDPFPASTTDPLQTQLDALDAAIVTGAIEVRFQDRMVRYQSTADMIKARNMLYLRLHPEIVRQIRMKTSKGIA